MTMPEYWRTPLALIQLSRLDEVHRQSLLRRQGALDSHCGCTVGALIALTALAIYLGSPHPVRSAGSAILGGAVWFLSAALAGKALSKLGIRLSLLFRAYLLCRRAAGQREFP